MKPSTVISSVNTRSLLLGMFSFKFLMQVFVFVFLVRSRFFQCSIRGTLSVRAPTTPDLFEMAISGRNVSWNILFIEPNVDEGESTYSV